LGYNFGAGYTWLVADSLAMGSLLAVLSRGILAERARMGRFSVAIFAVAIAMLAVLAPVGILQGSTFTGGVFRLTAINLACTGILGFILFVGTSRWRSVVRRPVLQFFGEISYGLYLIHMLATDFLDHWMIRYFPGTYSALPFHFDYMVLRFVVNTGFAVALAVLSRRYFEEPFLKLKDRWTPSSASPKTQTLVYANESNPTRQTA
jgi:peptidoglycan/LPS O-acetylase OafA/YrhL